MTIFDVLTLIGGLCLFLFGMNLMGQALERRAGSKLQGLLSRLTTNKMAGFATGLGVTAVIQSSSATTVMVVGFVNSGLMTLRQAINVIMGANVGTTVTAWILSLAGVGDDNVFVKLLKPSSFTPLLALIGIVFYMFFKSNKKKDVGIILLGFATLMFGMDTMSGAVAGLRDVPAFTNVMTMFSNPVLGMLAGAVLTAIIQSSSASVGILQALASTGAVSYGAAIPIIMGQNIGTCVTALLSSFGTNKNAKRAALVHLSFNVIGTLVWLSVFWIIKATLSPALFGESATLAGIAVAHSAFNILCTILLLPMSSLLEKLAYKLVPEKANTEEKIAELDERLLSTPAVALENCKAFVYNMGERATLSLKNSLTCLEAYSPELAQQIRESEEQTDHYEDIIGTYLVKLSALRIDDADSAKAAKFLKAIGDFERISDHAVNILESAEEMQEKGIKFSEKASEELKRLSCAACEIIDLSYNAFINDDSSAALLVEPLEQVIDNMKEIMRNNHILRLQAGECSIDTGFIWSDLLTNIERVSDHCSNIALCILDAKERNMNMHESLRVIKSSNGNFEEKYNEYAEKYLIF